MITYLKGDLFSSPAQVQVNTVNVVGVMGKGVALEFKKRFPEMFQKYQTICENKSLEVGKLFLWKGPEKWILLFPTKKHWRNPSQLEYIEQGLQKFVENWQRLGVESIAFPRLGCGNGGLDWDAVRPLMEQYLKPLPIQIYVYVGSYGDGEPEHSSPDTTEQWLRGEDCIGFAMLKADLQLFLKKNDVLDFPDGTQKKIEWQGDELAIVNGDTIIIPDAEFSKLWEYVRDSGVVSLDMLPENLCEQPLVMLEILKKLHYVQDVIVSKNGIDFEKTMNGYQYVKADTGGEPRDIP